MTDVAKHCRLPQHVVRQRNFLKDGDRTVFNQLVENCNARTLVEWLNC